MFAEERQAYIIQHIQTKGSATVAELAEKFNVSKVTIRSDLQKIDEEGWIQRTHGGAIKSMSAGMSVLIDMRAQEQAAEKDVIGKAAAELVQNGETVIFDHGTTVSRLVAHLKPASRFTCISIDPVIATLVTHRHDVRVILTGGYLRSDIPLWGPDCVRTLQAHSPVDRAFIGVTGISPTGGLTTSFGPNAEIKQTITQVAREIIILADVTKIGAVGPYKFSDLHQGMKVITNSSAPASVIDSIRNAGVEVTLV